MFEIKEAKEAKQDVKKLAAYMMCSLKNGQAASNFLDYYNKQIQNLTTFPFGYRGIGFKYLGYEIRIKPFSSYNIFFVVDQAKNQIPFKNLIIHLSQSRMIALFYFCAQNITWLFAYLCITELPTPRQM